MSDLQSKIEEAVKNPKNLGEMKTDAVAARHGPFQRPKNAATCCGCG